MGYFEQDTVLRMIRQVAAMVARITGAREDRRFDEAKADLEEAYQLLLTRDRQWIRTLDPATVAPLLDGEEAARLFAALRIEEEALVRAMALAAEPK